MSGVRVLVSAASAHGATEVIAEEIGSTLTGHGFDVTVLPPREVASVDEYDAFVIGSAVYRGHWLGSATGLVDRFGAALGPRPVWLFSSGPVGKPGGRLARSMARDPIELPAVRSVTRARGHRIFPGDLSPGSLTGFQRVALLAFPSLKGDFRDWAAVRQWADAIARDLRELAKA